MKNSEMVLEYLKQEGLCPELHEDEVIIFKYQMATFLYIIDDDDEHFFSLAMPSIYDVTEDNRISVLEAINQVSFTVKVAKLYIPHEVDNVWASAEVLLDGTPELDDIVPRLLHVLLGARQEFFEAINE